MTRVIGVIVHNWPLKLAAIGLATLLYGGLVLSQSTQEFHGVIQPSIKGQPDDTFLLTAVQPVTVVRYFAPSGIRPIATTFSATVDVSDVDPAAGPQLVPIVVTSLDDRITVLSSDPDVMTVDLDPVETRSVPVVVERGTVPPGLELGDTTVDPSEVAVSGPASVVDRVVAARANVTIQPSGIDIDEDVALLPVDQLGEVVAPAEVSPTTARVKVPVFTDRQSKSVPVSPVVTGTPAAGFEVASLTVDPAVVTVEADADQLAPLERIDTAPIPLTGLSSDETVEVDLAMPNGVVPLDRTTVNVTVKLRQVTATRSFDVGLELAGAAADRAYEIGSDRVLITVGGSTADLDRLEGAALVGTLDVAGLDEGEHNVSVAVDLPAGVTLVSASPDKVRVTVSAARPATVTPSPALAPSEPVPSGSSSSPTPSASAGG